MQNHSLMRAHFILNELKILMQDASFCRSDAFIQHGDTSVLLHCVAVAFYATMLLDILHVHYDRRSLVRGALLHDFFLYDWHKRKRRKGEKMHAFSHPEAALNNARGITELSPKEENIILRHMFPVTPVPPASIEGFAVCLADKGCAFYEGICRNTYPSLRKFCMRLLATAQEN